MLAAGSAGAAITGVSVFASFKYALDRILLAKRPDAKRLLDKLSTADVAVCAGGGSCRESPHPLHTHLFPCPRVSASL